MMVFGGRDPAQKVTPCQTRRNARLLSAVGVDLEQDLGLQMGAVDVIHKQPQKQRDYRFLTSIGIFTHVLQYDPADWFCLD
jgi:hypothetical protein